MQFKPELQYSGLTSNYTLVYVLDQVTPEPPYAAVKVPSWLIKHIIYVWQLELAKDSKCSNVKAMKLLREILNLDLRQASDLICQIYKLNIDGVFN